MSKIQTIHSPSGEEMVVLPKQEYEDLVRVAALVDEDEDDIAMFDARMAELAEGRDERLPAEVSAAMLQGDSLLRALRRWKGLTQVQLSAKTELAQGYISDLEAGRKAGSPDALSRIAVALDVDPAWLGS